jgi:hypothetical protein
MYWLIARYALAASLGLAIGWTTQGWRKASEIQSLKTEVAKQSEKALEQTRQIRNATQRIIDRQRDEIATLNLGLDRTLSQLRDRPARLPSTASDCKGTTGAELSRVDAEFLAREAARADRLRSALKSCYEVRDAIETVR